MGAIKTVQSTTTITVGTTPTQLLGSNLRRCSVVFSPVVGGGANVMSVSFRADVLASTGMLNFLAGVGYLVVLTDGDMGDIITTQWFAVVDAGSVDVQVTEIMYE